MLSLKPALTEYNQKSFFLTNPEKHGETVQLLELKA